MTALSVVTEEWNGMYEYPEGCDVETHYQWVTRSIDKDERWSSMNWTPEGEMKGARDLLSHLPLSVLNRNNDAIIRWIKDQFILTEEQACVLLEELGHHYRAISTEEAIYAAFHKLLLSSSSSSSAN